MKSNVMKLKESRPKGAGLEEDDGISAGTVGVLADAVDVEATAEGWEGTEVDAGGGGGD